MATREPSRWWQWWRQPLIWGHSRDELSESFTDPVAEGLVRPDARVSTLDICPAWGSDYDLIEQVRRANHEFLRPWEATLPPGTSERLPTLSTYKHKMRRQAEEGESLVMAVWADGELASVVSVANVFHGALSAGNLGYWTAQDWTRQGITSFAVAHVIDLVIGELGLHRLEVNVRPENQASLALCNKLGLRHEGLKTRFMCIDKQWADHVAFAVDAEMLRLGGLVETRIRNRQI